MSQLLHSQYDRSFTSDITIHARDSAKFAELGGLFLQLGFSIAKHPLGYKVFPTSAPKIPRYKWAWPFV